MPAELEDPPLFEGFDPPEPVVDPKLSAGQRLTLRQAALITVGIHPLTKRAIHPEASRHRDRNSPKADPFTCGTCVFRQLELHHDYTYPKCLADNGRRIAASAASDVRAWWPACSDYSVDGGANNGS